MVRSAASKQCLPTYGWSFLRREAFGHDASKEAGESGRLSVSPMGHATTRTRDGLSKPVRPLCGLQREATLQARSIKLCKSPTVDTRTSSNL